MGYKEDFEFYFQEVRGNLEEYLRPCVNQIHDRGVELGIEFDGYYSTNKQNVKDMNFSVEEKYFVNKDRRTLYILSAAFCNDEIMGMLDEALKRTPYYPICRKIICSRINYLGSVGVTFLPAGSL